MTGLKSSQNWSIGVISLLLFGAVWIWLSRATPGSTTQGAIPAPQKGFSAPDFSLYTLDGQLIHLADLRGRPVLINVWASWCPPCKAEMPAMQRVYQAYQDQGFTVLGVNATDQDSLQLALEFVKQEGLTFSILPDPDGAVSEAYQVRSLPTSFFVDRQGIIQEVVIGGPMSEALLRIRVEKLIQSNKEQGP